MIRNYRGFTLAELIIVAAMVVILVVVTGSQLMAYNYQGANATAAADCRNAASAEKAFFAQWGVYASSSPGGMAGYGWVFISSANSTGQIWAGSISGTAPSATIPAPGFQVGVSQNVGLVIHTSAAGGSYAMGCKNASGDRCFGMDSDTGEVYWVNGNIGAGLTSASIPAAVAGISDFTPYGWNVAGAGVCNGNPAGSGQYVWTAL